MIIKHTQHFKFYNKTIISLTNILIFYLKFKTSHYNLFLRFYIYKTFPNCYEQKKVKYTNGGQWQATLARRWSIYPVKTREN